MSEGCQHREHELETTCNKVCDPGHTLCPYHLLLAQSEGRLCVETPDPTPPPKKTAARVTEKIFETPRAYRE